MKSRLGHLLIIFFIGITTIHAQIGFAVAQDKDGSTAEWDMCHGGASIFDCKMKASMNLIRKGHDNVKTQEGSTCCGHQITSGFIVVVTASYQNDSGKTITDYGMGASAESFTQATKHALKNMNLHSLKWTDHCKYEVVKEITF